jgi:hypothetical protein
LGRGFRGFRFRGCRCSRLLSGRRVGGFRCGILFLGPFFRHISFNDFVNSRSIKSSDCEIQQQDWQMDVFAVIMD